MKLIIFLWLIKLVVFGSTSTSPCTTPDCGEKEFAMKDVKFNIDFNLGEVLSRSKTKCDLPQPTIAAPTHDCKEVFKAIYPASVLSTTLNTDSFDLKNLEIETGDLIRCKIEEMDISYDYSGYKQIGSDIHTTMDRNIIYMTAPASQCFSFAVKARNYARIILKNSLNVEDRIEIVLGAHNNSDITYKVMRNECEHKLNNPPYPILNAYEFVDYWICWSSGKAILGKGDQVILGEKEIIDIKDPIEYIGLGTGNFATGVWKVMESNCPGCYEVEQSGSSARVSCVKVQDTCT